jgi:uncharacterized protein
MSTFVLRVQPPRPSFALDMSDEEREIMGRHAAYWQRFVDSGQMVIFGPVLDSTGSWGLGVIEAEDEEELRAFAAADPAVTAGAATIRARNDARRVRASPLIGFHAWAARRAVPTATLRYRSSRRFARAAASC